MVGRWCGGALSDGGSRLKRGVGDGEQQPEALQAPLVVWRGLHHGGSRIWCGAETVVLSLKRCLDGF